MHYIGVVVPIKGFHGGIIIAITPRTHALINAEFLDELTVLLTRIGAATVTVQDCSLPR